MTLPSLKAVAKALSIAGLMAVSTMSQATLVLRVSDGTTTVNITDGSLFDANTAAGAVTYIGAVGSNWFLNVSTAIGTGAFQGGFGIDLNSINVSSGAGSLTVSMSENSLIWDNPGPTAAHVGGKIGGVTAGNVSYGLYTDNSNTLFGQGTTIFTGTGTGAFSNSGGTDVNLADPFSMTATLTINHAGPGNTSYNFTGQVPEPSTLALTGLALLGLIGVTRRRRST